jgi:hypothetical protein
MAGQNLVGDGDDAASRGVAGGGEEEILGEGVQVRIPARLARVLVRWEVVRVRRATEMVEFQSWSKEEERERRRRERGPQPTTRCVCAACLLAPLIGGVKEAPTWPPAPPAR